MPRRERAFLLAFILSLTPLATAEERSVTVRGVAPMGGRTTIDEARQGAIKDARGRAIEEACRIFIRKEAFVRNNLLSASFLQLSVHGVPLEVQKIDEGTEMVRKSPADRPTYLYFYSLRARIRCTKGEPDPEYMIHARINRTTFRTGEKASFNVTVSKDSYLTVLNLSADGEVYVLRPNFVEKASGVRADQMVEIPSPRERNAGISIVVKTNPGSSRDVESVLLVATRRPISLLAMEGRQGELASFKTPELAFEAVARWMVQIPISERVGTVLHYEVHAR